jgi:hypothetical protein
MSISLYELFAKSPYGECHTLWPNSAIRCKRNYQIYACHVIWCDFVHHICTKNNNELYECRPFYGAELTFNRHCKYIRNLSWGYPVFELSNCRYPQFFLMSKRIAYPQFELWITTNPFSCKTQVCCW